MTRDALRRAAEEKKSLNNHEPPPKKNGHPAVWPWVIERFKEQLPTAEQKRVGHPAFVARWVVNDMAERHMQGIEKYSVPLQPHNGRDALVDAYQETMDLCAYLGQLSMEQGYQDVLLHKAMMMAFKLRERLKERDKL